jgi:hypothetical protein
MHTTLLIKRLRSFSVTDAAVLRTSTREGFLRKIIGFKVRRGASLLQVYETIRKSGYVADDSKTKPCMSVSSWPEV